MKFRSLCRRNPASGKRKNLTSIHRCNHNRNHRNRIYGRINIRCHSKPAAHRTVHPSRHSRIPGLDSAVLPLQKRSTQTNRKNLTTHRRKIRRDLRNLRKRQQTHFIGDVFRCTGTRRKWAKNAQNPHKIRGNTNFQIFFIGDRFRRGGTRPR